GEGERRRVEEHAQRVANVFEDRADHEISSGTGRAERRGEAIGRRRRQAAQRLPPEPGARRERRTRGAQRELLFEIAENEVAPFRRQAPADQPDGGARRSHLTSLPCRRGSRPSAIAVKAWYA